ncbi:hypothetical protein COCNU_scaffold003768G000020 [Cocos nucifera]|nr:hypothetical protein [Cocos nucifera]
MGRTGRERGGGFGTLPQLWQHLGFDFRRAQAWDPMKIWRKREEEEGRKARLVMDSFEVENYNALSYDDKILDGFYDLYGILVESSSIKMPSLVDLQGMPVSDSISWEAVLVNKAEDADLLKLEQKALMMALESRSESSNFAASVLVQRLAILVANYMGGIVYDPESMLKSYQNLSNYLRESAGNMVLPLGRLTIGLAQHRALLFKVNNPSSLL